MKTEIRVPEVAENVTEGKVVSLLVAKGDSVEVDQNLIELETEKAVVGIPSTVAGTVAELLVEEGATVKVGDAIATVDGNGAGPAPKPEAKPAAPAAKAPEPEPEPEPEPAPAPKAAAAPPSDSDESGAPASPAVRRLARRLGADIRQVEGTGPGGRISADDVQDFVKRIMESGGGAAPSAGVAPAPLPDLTRWGPVRREALSQVRQITARTMTQAWTTIPQVTQSGHADITELERFRGEWNARRAEDDPALTVTAILLKICAEALQRFPQFNASFDAAAGELVYREYRHLGVAVDTDRGLLVPVVRDADQKGIAQLSRELDDLARRARAKRIGPDEMEGGTFTLSNLGGIGGTNFSPIVYPPQVSILGISRAAQTPLWRDGAFVPRLTLPLDLSYDHRVIDGADGARFLRWIVAALEQPLQLLM
ncbi:2-oxo acid dehydrogenase subunit E2 [bacterium]|nr:2-oxo acid dehydrogenase subunit E2 [bacterium]